MQIDFKVGIRLQKLRRLCPRTVLLIFWRWFSSFR